MQTRHTRSIGHLRAARKKQRGVVLTEALIAISMIIVMFAGVVYFHNAYDAKAKVLRDARMQAWKATDQACDGDGKGQAMLTAAVPYPYATAAASELSISAKHEMKCNEKHDARTTVSGVLAWSGLGKQLGDFGHMLVEALKF
jgi:Flp pilus assembly protein TadG